MMPDGGRLPDFLVIGAKKAGSTWLDAQLRSHPAVSMPTRRKEVAYFDLYHARGPEWYAGFFRDAPAGSMVGESTPEYLHHPEAAGRIQAELPQARLLAIVREPVARLHSEWVHERMKRGIRQPFAEWVDGNPAAVAKSRYAQALRGFRRAGDEGRLLVLVLEESVADPAGARHRIADFLGIDPGGFRSDGSARHNESFTPRHARAYAAMVGIANWMRRHDLDRVVNALLATGAKRLIGRQDAPRLSNEDRARLAELADTERELMERMLGRKIPAWQAAATLRP